jgi:hypothetical protein
MNNEKPQLSPAEYGITTIETVVAPDLEPGTEEGSEKSSVTAQTDDDMALVMPDIDPPVTDDGSDDIVSDFEEGIGFIAPEFSPPDTVQLEPVTDELVAPEQLPSSG